LGDGDVQEKGGKGVLVFGDGAPGLVEKWVQFASEV
jgi:hypothetical protein